jgi:hypothetical protein
MFLIRRRMAKILSRPTTPELLLNLRPRVTRPFEPIDGPNPVPDSVGFRETGTRVLVHGIQKVIRSRNSEPLLHKPS